MIEMSETYVMYTNKMCTLVEDRAVMHTWGFEHKATGSWPTLIADHCSHTNQ